MSYKFSKEEDDIIKQMNGKGFTPEEISKVIRSRTKGSIKDRGYVLGLNWSPKVDIDRELFKKLMKER